MQTYGKTEVAYEWWAGNARFANMKAATRGGLYDSKTQTVYMVQPTPGPLPIFS